MQPMIALRCGALCAGARRCRRSGRSVAVGGVCLEYCRRRLTGDGVVASDSDELEGRFPAGDANLWHLVALLRRAALGRNAGRELHKPARQLAAYERQAAALRKNIDRHFGGMVEGFETIVIIRATTVCVRGSAFR